MSTDYSVGCYVAFGIGAEGPRVGFAEDRRLQSDNGTWQFQIDGDEVYGLGGDLVGYIEDGIASRATSGQFLFRLKAE